MYHCQTGNPGSSRSGTRRVEVLENCRGHVSEYMTRAVSIFMVALASLAVQRVYAQPPAAPVAGQAQPVAVRGTEMAGATQFRAHCETCHGKIARAPSLGMLRRMAPERIYQAL